ncbi:MAG TPA: CapA family protein [Candidatus Saccharimonadia bacterium]|jgi:poly-gamma-glutamate synthesis protein (capsule biosynthesis protein)|nr:CapA family protein [Candidatus Saccharimonadia bacterium]
MKRRLPQLAIASAVVLVTGTAVGVSAVRSYHTVAKEAYRLSYWEEPGLPNLDEKIRFFANTNATTALKTDRGKATFLITAHPQAGSIPVRTETVGQPAKLSGGTIVSPTTKTTAYLTITRSDATTRALTANFTTAIKGALATSTWTLDALGDIIIGRDVYEKILQYGDPIHPFANYLAELQRPNFTVADLECSFSDDRAVITQEGMTFVSPARGAAGLKAAGIDAVNLANNHSYNAGAAGYIDTINTLDSLGVAHFGGGRNDTEARTPLVRDVQGVRVAMLGYSSIVGSHAAGPDDPGMGYLDMAPWGTLNDDQVKQMEADIRAAKAKADVVLVYYHWGTEYTHDANADQREVAHRAIDAGADVILGTHPHWVQGVEWYHNRLITYSLGNFIFDQEWANETKQGTILQMTFDGSTIASATLAPYTISDYNQPAPATPDTAAATLQDIFTHSWWPN